MDAGSQTYMTASAHTGGVHLNHILGGMSTSEKLKTTSAGVTVTGDIAVTGTVDGVDIATRDGVLTTTTTTAGNALPKAGGTLTGDVSHGDHVKAKFGADNDLEIYSDGTNAIIKENTGGSLYIGAADLHIMKSDFTEYYISAFEDGAVQLCHDNSLKLATTDTGIDVTGDITVSGGVDFGAVTGDITSKTLDDYTEGTFGGNQTGSSTYYGTYTKIGNMVTIHCEYDIFNSTTGVIAIAPFTPYIVNSSDTVGQSITRSTSTTHPSGTYAAVSQGTTNIYAYNYAGVALGIPTNGTGSFQFSYQTA